MEAHSALVSLTHRKIELKASVSESEKPHTEPVWVENNLKCIASESTVARSEMKRFQCESMRIPFWCVYGSKYVQESISGYGQIFGSRAVIYINFLSCFRVIWRQTCPELKLPSRRFIMHSSSTLVSKRRMVTGRETTVVLCSSCQVITIVSTAWSV